MPFLYEKLTDMKESSTYQLILHEGIAQGEARGEAKGLREAILDVATEQFGRPDDAARSALDGVDDIERLKALLHRVLHVSGWDELLK